MSSYTGFSLSFISILLHSMKNSAICPSLFSFKTMAVSNALPADRMITLDEIGLILLFLLYQYRYFLLILRESIKSLHVSLLTVQEFAEACALGVSRFDSFSFRCCYPQCGDLSVGFSGRLSRLSMLANGNPGFAMVLLTVSRASHLSCATTSGDGGPSFTVVPGFSSSCGLCVLIRHRLWYGRRHYVMWPLLISGLPCLLGVFQLDRLLALRVPHCVCLVHI